MMKIEIRGMSVFANDDGRAPFRTLALAEIFLPEIGLSVRNIRLVWSEERGYTALSPMPWRGNLSHVSWYHHTDFATKLVAALIDMYERMGNELPSPKPVFRFDHVTGKPISLDSFDDPLVIVSTEAASRAERHRERRNEAGLLRTLGCPIEETLERAGI